MTTGAFGRLSRLTMIFNALQGERFVRRSLLREFIELASEGPRFAEVHAAATVLLGMLEDGADAGAFDRGLQTIGVALATLEDQPASAEGARISLPTAHDA
jgi:hypothetical protein